MSQDLESFGSMAVSYTGNIRVPARRCRPLALLLVQSLPADKTPEEAARLETVVQRGDEVDDSITVRERGSVTALRDPRNKLVSSIVSMHSLLVAVAALPGHLGPRGAEAQALLATLFPEGTTFVQIGTVELWQHTNRLLERIVEEGHRPKLVELASEPMMLWLETATRDVGRVLGVRDAVVVPVSPRIVGEAVTRFSVALGAYCRTLAANVDPDDQASVRRFLQAVAPIDEMRSKRGDGDGDGEDVEAEPTAQPVRPGMPGADPFTPA